MKLTQKDWTTLSELLDQALDLPMEALRHGWRALGSRSRT